MNTSVNARHGRRDRGSSLLLTIGFVVMIGAISAGLAGLVTSGLNNTVTLERIRDRQYAADGAVENAIAEVRSQMEISDTCVDDTSGISRTNFDNEISIRVDWSGACGVAQGANGLIFLQRNIDFTACLIPTGSVADGEACTNDTAIISAQVNFEQGGAGPVRSTVIQSWSVDR